MLGLAQLTLGGIHLHVDWRPKLIVKYILKNICVLFGCGLSVAGVLASFLRTGLDSVTFRPQLDGADHAEMRPVRCTRIFDKETPKGRRHRDSL